VKIWVFAESEGDKPTTATLELLTKAREIADTVEAVYVGKNGDAIAPQLGEYGAAKVFTADQGDALSGVVGAAVIAGLVDAEAPDAILFVQSYDGRDAIGRLSAKLNRTVLTNATSIAVDGETLKVGNAIFGGNTLVDSEFDGP
jgi:electron transfer flavoprotein alpha subunit